jgi:hypothetical protein
VISMARSVTKSHSASTIHAAESQSPDLISGVCQRKAGQALTALTVEFVANPAEAKRAEHSIPAALESSLGELEGYAGCLVMISNLEARLITAITFWSGPNGTQLCRQNARWVNALLKPYMDRCLRSQTVFARMPSQLQLSPTKGREISSDTKDAVEFESDLLTVA